MRVMGGSASGRTMPLKITLASRPYCRTSARACEHEITVAADDQGDVDRLHRRDEGFKTTAFVDCALVEDEPSLRQVAGRNAVSKCGFDRGGRRGGGVRCGDGCRRGGLRRLEQGHIPDDRIVDPIHPVEFGGDQPIHGVAMREAGDASPFDCLPEPVDARTVDHLLHLAKKFVGVIQSGDVSETGDKVAGKDGIQVDRAKTVHFPEKQEKERAGHCIRHKKAFTTAEPGRKTVFAGRGAASGEGSPRSTGR